MEDKLYFDKLQKFRQVYRGSDRGSRGTLSDLPGIIGNSVWVSGLRSKMPNKLAAASDTASLITLNGDLFSVAKVPCPVDGCSSGFNKAYILF